MSVYNRAKFHPSSISNTMFTEGGPRWPPPRPLKIAKYPSLNRVNDKMGGQKYKIESFGQYWMVLSVEGKQ